MLLCTDYVVPYFPTGKALVRPRARRASQGGPGWSATGKRPETWRAECNSGAVLDAVLQESTSAHGTADAETSSRQDSGLHCSTSERVSSEVVLRSISDALHRAGGASFYRETGFLSNAVERRGVFQGVAHCAQAEPEGIEAQAALPTTKGRKRRVGKPAGLASWNKGISMPATTRQKISQAQKQRWQDPALRASVSEKQKGKVPWNKGKTLSKETRERMSRARRFAVYPEAFCSKLGRAHRGLTHSPETCALLSKKLSGKAKSQEHRAAIAAGQRRRYAASRLLNATRTFAPPEECDTAETGSSMAQDAPSIPDTEVLYSASSPGKRKASGAAKPSDNSAVVEEFVGQLRQFRSLQEELEPWTSAFRAEHKRKPRLEDVELTENEWLVNKYKEYRLMRGRLLNESQQLRNKIEGVGPRNVTNILGGTLYRDKLNANERATGSVSEGAARIASALKYRRSQNGVATPSDSTVPIAAPSLGQQQPVEQSVNGHATVLPYKSAGITDHEGASGDMNPDRASGDNPTPTATPAHAADSSRSGCGGNRAGDTGVADKDADVVNGTSPVSPGATDKGARIVSPSLLPGATPRVRSAMLAAMDYRKKKATQGKPEV